MWEHVSCPLYGFALVELPGWGVRMGTKVEKVLAIHYLEALQELFSFLLLFLWPVLFKNQVEMIHRTLNLFLAERHYPHGAPLMGKEEVFYLGFLR